MEWDRNRTSFQRIVDGFVNDVVYSINKQECFQRTEVEGDAMETRVWNDSSSSTVTEPGAYLHLRDDEFINIVVGDAFHG